jgi:outer membrane cobalamin receptor
VVLLGLLGLPVRAQPPQGELPQSETSPELRRRVPEITVAAERLPQSAEDPTAFRSVIELEKYRGEAQHIEDLLAEAVGVQVRRFGGDAERSEVSIRGSTSSQVVILLDGVRLNSAQSGSVDLSTIPLDLLERIEITRGGGSARVGSDAVGGVIRLVSRRPGGATRTRLHAGAASEYALGYQGFKTDGDYDFQRPTVEIGGVEIVPSPQQVERVNNRSEQHALLVNLGRAFGDTFYASLLDQVFFVSRGQPGLDSGTGATAGQRLRAHERRTRNIASLRLEATALGPLALEAETNLFHRYEKTEFEDPDPSLGGAFGDTIDTRDENQAFGWQTRLGHRISTAALSVRTGLELDLRLDTLDSNEFEDRERGTLGLLLREELGWFEERLRLVPALRYERTRDFDDRWIPRVGAVFEPWSWLRLKASWERSYRIPSLDELFLPDKGFLRGNPRLQPEEAVNVDAGVELAFDGWGLLRRARVQAVWFRHRIENSIVFALINPFTVAPINTGRADQRGYELAAEVVLGSWLQLAANGTWLDARFEASREPLPGRPDREVSFRAVIEPPSSPFKLVGEVHYTDRLPVSRGGNVFLESRTVYDASLGVNLARRARFAPLRALDELWLVLEARNLGDRGVRDARFFPQPGRQLAFRIEAGW